MWLVCWMLLMQCGVIVESDFVTWLWSQFLDNTHTSSLFYIFCINHVFTSGSFEKYKDVHYHVFSQQQKQYLLLQPKVWTIRIFDWFDDLLILNISEFLQGWMLFIIITSIHITEKVPIHTQNHSRKWTILMCV